MVVKFFGGSYYDDKGKARLVLNPTNSSSNNADLYLYSGGNIALKLYDQVTGSITLSSYGGVFLTTGNGTTHPEGNWNFSSANVTGIDTVAKFG